MKNVFDIRTQVTRLLTTLGVLSLMSNSCATADANVPLTPETRYKKAVVALNTSRLNDAERDLLALQTELKTANNKNELLEKVLNSIIALYYKAGTSQKAVPYFRELIALKEKLYGADDLSLAKTRESFAALLKQGGEEAEAKKEEDKAKARLDKEPIKKNESP